MKRLILVLFVVFAFGNNFNAQTVTVLKTEQIINSDDGEFYFPHFSKDDSEIIFTKSNYTGLYKSNIENKNIKQITNENGAGYKPFISEVSNNIFFKSFIIKEGRKFNSLKKYDLRLNTTEVIEQDKRFLNLLNQTNTSNVSYMVNHTYKTSSIANAILTKSIIEPSALHVENNELFMVKNNSAKIINPLGKGIYVWESFSKDGQKIVFSFENKGAFICDIDGNILHNIPEAHYPKFSPNGKFVLFMIDSDNGTSYTSSDIYVYSLDDEKSYPITKTKDNIEMYAEWSSTGDRIVYHTTKGEIYITKLDIQN